jgi:DNA-binding response OmpR family regulator
MDTSAATGPGVPPIVLFVEDDPDTLDMYATYFELSGVWVAKSTSPGDALGSILELLPDLVVTDMGFAGLQSGVELVTSLKTSEQTRDIPVIILSGGQTEQIPAPAREAADLCLIKPVLPDALLADVHRLIAGSTALRERSARARSASDELAGRSAALLERSNRLSEAETAATGSPARALNARPCPDCSEPLEWIERGAVAGAEYDYYRWCRRGCGLYCFDRAAETWVKLV